MNILLLLSSIVLVSLASKRLLGGKYPAPDHGFMGRDYTTALKGLAIVMIMLGHCGSLWTGGRMLTPLGGIGVALFLITSGYGLNESYKAHGLSNFWMKRLSKVYLPYLTVVIVWALFNWESWNHFLLQAVCVRSMYWFVTYIIGWYILFWFCSRLLPRWRLVLFFAAGVASVFLLPEIQAEQALSFPTGVLLSRYRESCTGIILDKRLRITILLFIVGGECCF
ncbi:acyltransferase family protein [Alistipes sp.]|uniref:acyltransferase family protein n=1 Tax=Alistipes sp. TaxID=1872444 RepID=UPI003AF08495